MSETWFPVTLNKTKPALTENFYFILHIEKTTFLLLHILSRKHFVNMYLDKLLWLSLSFSFMVVCYPSFLEERKGMDFCVPTVYLTKSPLVFIHSLYRWVWWIYVHWFRLFSSFSNGFFFYYSCFLWRVELLIYQLSTTIFRKYYCNWRWDDWSFRLIAYAKRPLVNFSNDSFVEMWSCFIISGSTSKRFTTNGGSRN